MPPRRQRRPGPSVRGDAAVRAENTPRDHSTATWRREAEAHLRQAARALEVIGLTDNEAARHALMIYRIASRVRSDRLERAA